MRITVKVKTSAKENQVEKTGEGEYRVLVKAKPVEGKANEAVREALAEHFDIPRSKVVLLLGQTSKQKVFEIFRR
jgi:uncharacterized protein